MQTENLAGPIAKISAATTGTSVAFGTAGMPLTIAGLTLSEWAAALTVLFVTFQIIVILPKVRERVVGWVQAVRAWLRKGR